MLLSVLIESTSSSHTDGPCEAIAVTKPCVDMTVNGQACLCSTTQARLPVCEGQETVQADLRSEIFRLIDTPNEITGY